MELLRVLRMLRLADDLWLDPNLAVLILLNLSSSKHFVQDVSSSLAILYLSLHLLHLCLHLVKLSQLILNGLLSDCFFSLLISDLASGSSPLDASFQHVGTISLLSCNDEKEMLDIFR